MEQDQSLKPASFLRGRVPALALEVLAIVFGILLAFIIDASWEARGDRVREHRYIVRLTDEFEAGRRELEADLQVRGQLLDGWSRLLRTPTPDRDSVGAILSSMNERRFYTPVHAVFDDLVSSGGLSLLRSDALRIAILDYTQELARVATVEASESQLVMQTVLPYLIDNAEFLPWIPMARRDSLGMGNEVPVRDPTLLLRDPTFRNILYLRWQRGDVTQRYSARLHGMVLEVLRLLREEGAR